MNDSFSRAPTSGSSTAEIRTPRSIRPGTSQTLTCLHSAGVTAAGNLAISEANGVNLLDLDTVNGTITVTTGGATTITDVQSGTNGTVSITASTGSIEVGTFLSGSGAGSIIATAGAITDADDNSTVTAGVLTLTAQSGIGAGAGLDINTTATSLDASVTAAGNLFVVEANAINLLDSSAISV